MARGLHGGGLVEAVLVQVVVLEGQLLRAPAALEDLDVPPAREETGSTDGITKIFSELKKIRSEPDDS